MAEVKYPITPAVRFLRAHDIPFEPFLYTYEERGGTKHSAAALGVPEHSVIKTLVMETAEGKPLIVLMHGDCEVSTQALARHLEVKSVAPCKPEVAQKHTGYLPGGTSPFGTRKSLAIYAERTIFDLSSIYINGGKRGFLVRLDARHLTTALQIEQVDVAIRNTP